VAHVIEVRDSNGAAEASLLRINSHAQPHVALLNASEVRRLVGLGARVVVAIDDDQREIGYAILIASECRYDGEEFSHFRERATERFLYVDQVAVEAASRSRGIATLLYRHVERVAQAIGARALCCEVNIDPPNPVSRRFHAGRGFIEIGEMDTRDGRRVSLLWKDL
jgi:predicted GNAT superfamily acetyltransferase